MISMGNSSEHETNMEVYYHYTNPQAANAIIRSGVIKKSSTKAKGRDDAVYGEGVYLTRIPPDYPKFWIALNNWDGNISAIAHKIVEGKHYRCI